MHLYRIYIVKSPRKTSCITGRDVRFDAPSFETNTLVQGILAHLISGSYTRERLEIRTCGRQLDSFFFQVFQGPAKMQCPAIAFGTIMHLPVGGPHIAANTYLVSVLQSFSALYTLFAVPSSKCTTHGACRRNKPIVLTGCQIHDYKSC